MAQTLQGHEFGGLGLDDAQPDVTRVFEAAGVIALHDVVAFVAVTDPTVGVTVEQLDVSDAAPLLIAGVAQEAADAAGDLIRVCRMGPTLVNIGDATITAGQAAGLHASADGCADNADATEGSFGTFLSANDVGGTNKAVVDVRLSSRAPDA